MFRAVGRFLVRALTLLTRTVVLVVLMTALLSSVVGAALVVANESLYASGVADLFTDPEPTAASSPRPAPTEVEDKPDESLRVRLPETTTMQSERRALPIRVAGSVSQDHTDTLTMETAWFPHPDSSMPVTVAPAPGTSIEVERALLSRTMLQLETQYRPQCGEELGSVVVTVTSQRTGHTHQAATTLQPDCDAPTPPSAPSSVHDIVFPDEEEDDEDGDTESATP